MATLTSCPPRDSLRSVLLGLGNPDAASEIEQHLASCGPCAEAASQLQSEDDLVRTLRQAAWTDDTPEPEVVATLVSVFSRIHPSLSGQTAEWRGSVSGSSTSAATSGFLAPPQAPDEIGRLGSFVIHELLGAGGMGVVYRGYDPQLDRAVAIKVIRPELLQAPGMQDRFVAEARAAAAVENDHIVVIHSVGIHEGVPSITMPLLRGETLDHRLRQRAGPFNLTETLRIGREVATGLAAAHAQGLVHRDIKPANLWLETPSDRVKILDFGLALSTDLAGSGAGFAGTPGYMAPEQARGRAVDARTDLYSLGCVLHRLATGTLPLEADTPIGLIVRTVTDTPRPTAEVNPRVTPALARLIDRLLAKNPEDRPESAEVVRTELLAMESAETQKQFRITRRRWLVGLAAAAGLGGFVAWAAFQTEAAPEVLPVKLDLAGDTDVGRIVFRRDGKEVPVDLTTTQTVSLEPGEYEVRPAKPVPNRELVPAAVNVLPHEPLTLRFALVGETATLKDHAGAVSAVAVIQSRDRSMVLSVSLDRTLNLWFPDNKDSRKQQLTSPGTCLAATPTGSLIATAGGNRQSPFELDIHLFNGTDLQRQDKKLSGHTRLLSAVALSPDGKRLLSASRDDLRLWDLERSTYRELSDHGPNTQVLDAAFSSDGKYALTGDDEGFVVLWDAVEGKGLRRLIAQGAGMPGEVQAVAFTPTGFVTGGTDGIIRIWDRTTYKARELPTLPNPIEDLAVSSDGKRMLSATGDGVVRLWALAEGSVLREFAGHRGRVKSVAFDPGERSAVSGGHDGTVRVWRLPY